MPMFRKDKDFESLRSHEEARRILNPDTNPNHLANQHVETVKQRTSIAGHILDNDGVKIVPVGSYDENLAQRKPYVDPASDEIRRHEAEVLVRGEDNVRHVDFGNRQAG